MVYGPNEVGLVWKPGAAFIVKVTGMVCCAAAGLTPVELMLIVPLQVVEATVSVGKTAGFTATVKVAMLPLPVWVTATQLGGAVTPLEQAPAAKLEAATALVRVPVPT